MNTKEAAVAVQDFRLVELNDLPKYSPWPARLLGLTEWTPRKRNGQLISTEYGEKWGTLLQEYENNKFAHLREATQYLFSAHFPSDFLFHVGERIYYSENNDSFWNFFYGRIGQVLTEYMSRDDTLVELGCGWGRNLFYALQSRLCRDAIGGEYTEEGLTLGGLVGEEFKLPIEFLHFDYYNPDREFLKKLKGTVVFTHNSIEQIRYMPEQTISSLIESEPKAVIHFEPVYEYRDEDTLLHYLWKRYTEVNDYNRNLLTVLKKFEKERRLKIGIEKIHALGLNAFNPGSFITWEPK
jgi:hypothetical protein